MIIPTLDRGGAEKQLSLLATGLPRDRFDVHVAVLTRTGPLEAGLQVAGIPVHFIHKRGKFDPLAWRRLRRLILDLKPDVVHTWLFAGNSYGRSAALAAGVKCIIGGERCVDPWKHWYQFAIDRWLAKRSACIATNSAGVRDFYVEHGIAADKFVVIPNGVEVVSPPPLSREKFLAECKLPPNARLIAAVGRLWPQKRLKDLIWGADLLKCVHDDPHLLIIGDGPQRYHLERFTRQCEIEDRVHFLGERSDVPQILPLCECLWLGSGYEGQPNAVMEAMAAGLPVIATDIAGNRELVVPEETGYLVTAGDRAAFARWTLVLLKDEEQRKRMGVAGKNRIEQEFSVSQMIGRYAELYDRLVSQIK